MLVLNLPGQQRNQSWWRSRPSKMPLPRSSASALPRPLPPHTHIAANHTHDQQVEIRNELIIIQIKIVMSA